MELAPLLASVGFPNSPGEPTRNMILQWYTSWGQEPPVAQRPGEVGGVYLLLHGERNRNWGILRHGP